jgi:hypothetical protein
MWFRWKYDGTNLIYQVSRDGNFFTTILKELLTTHLSTAPTSAGFGFNVNTSTSGISLGLECLSFTLTQP